MELNTLKTNWSAAHWTTRSGGSTQQGRPSCNRSNTFGVAGRPLPGRLRWRGGGAVLCSGTHRDGRQPHRPSARSCAGGVRSISTWRPAPDATARGSSGCSRMVIRNELDSADLDPIPALRRAPLLPWCEVSAARCTRPRVRDRGLGCLHNLQRAGRVGVVVLSDLDPRRHHRESSFLQRRTHPRPSLPRSVSTQRTSSSASLRA